MTATRAAALDQRLCRRLRTCELLERLASTRRGALQELGARLAELVGTLGTIELDPDGAEIDTARLLTLAAACFEPLAEIEDLAAVATVLVGSGP